MLGGARSKAIAAGLAATIAGLVPCAGSAQAASGLPPIHHVFVIVLENKEFAEWFGFGPTQDPYLTGTLANQGALLPNYFGVGHSSADNYIAMISGQPPTSDSKNDCPDPLQTVSTASDSGGVAQSNGCLYPPNFNDIGDQLTAAGHSWKAYAESMPSNCYSGHDAPGNYARKHNGFVFFQSGIQNGQCAANDVPLTPNLANDLASASTTAAVNYIFPNECDDGHSDCTHASPLAPVPEVGSEADELAQADAFLKQYVPAITSSPAFQDNGLLFITWDEGDDPFGCCGEPMQDPDGSYPGGEAGSPGNGGGQVGAVAISKFIAPGTVSPSQYNHYSLLASIEDLFGLPHLAEARQSGTTTFGSDVYTRPGG